MSDDIDRQRQHFESISSTYYNARSDANHLQLKTLLWRYAFSRHRDLLPQNASVLEAMCGYGEGRRILSDAFHGVQFTYSGFDYSRPLVEKARQALPGVDVVVADAVSFVPERSYDVVVLIGGLHHVFAHSQKVLKNLWSATKPGGFFVNFEPTQDNWLFKRIRSRIYERNEIFDIETERAFDLDLLNDLYRGAGFTVVDQFYPGLLAYILYYNPDAFPKLNVGSTKAVKAVFSLESHFYRGYLARKFSFATLSILRRPSV